MTSQVGKAQYHNVLLTAALAAGLSASAVFAGEGGTLRGQFVYDGKAPMPDPVAVTADKAFCGKHKLVDESLVVGEGSGVANVIVYLYLKRGESVDVHPAYAALKDQKVQLDNEKCRFNPRVALLWTQQQITLGNKDAIGHNTKIDCLTNKPINPLLPPGGSIDHKFDEAERLPVQVGCNIHPWMRAWLVIRDNPYFAVTDAEGKFEIKHIPPGDWQFQFWHEKVGYVRNVKIDGNEFEWSRGRLDVSVADGKTNDVGTVKLSPAIFEQ